MTVKRHTAARMPVAIAAAVVSAMIRESANDGWGRKAADGWPCTARSATCQFQMFMTSISG